LSIGRGLVAAGTLIELAPGLGFLSICPRHHYCCYAANDRPHQHPLRFHLSTPFVVRRGLFAGGMPTTENNSKLCRRFK
jgi:hypothetical protein